MAKSNGGGNGRRATRDTIVAAATRLMHVQGYQATTLDDVLRESGAGKGSFFHYFRSKEDLGYAILDEIVRSFLQRTVEPCFADPAGSPLDQIRCFLDRLLEAQRQCGCVGGCAMGNLASELSDVHEGFRARLASVFGTWRERLAAVLERAAARGEIGPECRPAALAQFLVAAMEGAILMAKVTKDIGVMEECVVEIKRHLAGYDRRVAR